MDLNQVYKYCPRCRNNLITDSGNSVLCQKCKLHIYINPKPTNGLILENNKGQILLVQRKNEPKKDMWDIPGGFVELKETVIESLQREIKEELGLTLKDLNYLGNYWSYYPYQDINYQTLLFAYFSKFKGETIRISDDVKDYRFFEKKDISFDLIAFDDVKSALNDYLKKYP